MEVGGEEVDPENFEILKRKIAVVDKLLKHKEKLEQTKTELTTENMLKENIILNLKVCYVTINGRERRDLLQFRNGVIHVLTGGGGTLSLEL